MAHYGFFSGMNLPLRGTTEHRHGTQLGHHLSRG